MTKLVPVVVDPIAQGWNHHFALDKSFNYRIIFGVCQKDALLNSVALSWFLKHVSVSTFALLERYAYPDEYVMLGLNYTVTSNICEVYCFNLNWLVQSILCGLPTGNNIERVEERINATN
jgi:hypothetical protein